MDSILPGSRNHTGTVLEILLPDIDVNMPTKIYLLSSKDQEVKSCKIREFGTTDDEHFILDELSPPSGELQNYLKYFHQELWSG